MSKSDAFETDLLRLLFNATAIANLAQNGTSPITSLYVALHTADPGETGVQNTNEVAYTGYARVAVARTTGGWAVTDNTVRPVAPIVFGICTAGPTTATHWSVGVAASGASKMLYSGEIEPALVIAVGVIPEMSVTTNITED